MLRCIGGDDAQHSRSAASSAAAYAEAARSSTPALVLRNAAQ